LRSQPLSGLPSQLSKPVLQPGLQTPALQLGVPFSAVQVWPQVPQSAVVFVAFSQPSLSVPLQLPKFALQEPILQLPVVHVGVALARVQVVPQAPQFVLVLSAVSQPFGRLESQSPKPVPVQLGTQTPPVHAFGALVCEQTMPQPPQLDVPCAVSQPVAVELSQLKNPLLQLPILQVMLVLGTTSQLAAAFANEQLALQAPQFDSVLMSRSQPLSLLPSQVAKPKLQPGLQLWEPALPAHVGVPFSAVHTWSQPPQSLTVLSWVSQVVLPSQSSKSEAQVVATQVPVVHDSLEVGKSQTVPHEPQSLVVSSERSQPLLLVPSQSS
jgi:hypothetical protein